MANRYVLRFRNPAASVAADAGAYALTGAAADLRVGRRLGADAGSYAITGTDATLTEAASGPTILLETRWENSTGTSFNARTDGGLLSEDPTGGGCDVTSVDLRVVVPGDAVGTWPSGVGNILTARNSTAGCGGVEMTNVYPAPAPGVLWGMRYYFTQDAAQIYTHNHGPGDLNGVGFIDIVFNEISAQGGGDWNPALRLGRQSEGTTGSAAGDDGGRDFNFQASTSSSSFSLLVLSAETVYLFDWILEWVSTTGPYANWRYRFYPTVRNLAGTLLADYTSWWHDSQVYTLEDFYNAGSSFLRRDSTGEESEIRSPYFGIAQSKATAVGRLYWGGAAAYTPSSITDHLGGI